MYFWFPSDGKQSDRQNPEDGRVGEPRIRESWKHGSSAFRRHSRVSTFVLSPRLGSRNRDPPRHQPRGPRWHRSPPPPPPLTATAIVADRCRCRCSRRHWPIPLPPPTTAAAGRCRHCRWLPPPSTAALVAARHCRQPLPLQPPPPAATAADHFRRRRRLPPPSTAAAAIAGRSRRRRPPPPAMVVPGPPQPPRSVAEGLGTRAIPAELAVNYGGSLPYRPRGRDDPHAKEALGPGDTLLPGAACVGGRPVTRPGAGYGGWSWPGRKGASHALAILHPGRRLLDPMTHIRLPGRAARWGPSPVVEIPDEAFAARRSVCAVPRVDHMTHLGGISLLYC